MWSRDCEFEPAYCLAASVVVHPDVYWKYSHRVVGHSVHQEVVIYSIPVNDIHSYFYRHYFAKTFNHIIGVEAARQATIKAEQQLTTTSAGNFVGSERRWSCRIFRRKTSLSTVPEDSASAGARTTPKGSAKRLRSDTIRRLDGQPKLVNPSGRITESDEQGQGPHPHQLAFADEMAQTPQQLELENNNSAINNLHVETINMGPADLRRNTPGYPRRLSDSSNLGELSNCVPEAGQGTVVSATSTGMLGTATVEFAPTVYRSHPPLSCR